MKEKREKRNFAKELLRERRGKKGVSSSFWERTWKEVNLSGDASP